MSSTYGENLKLSIFGQSHGPAIGMTLDGIPAGLPVDMEKLQNFLNRRAPGQNDWSTPRKEEDKPEFLGGILDGYTCGAPIAAVIYNKNTRSGDYENLKNCPRPGHADYTAQVKYGGFQDAAGGGHFSGRLTAPLCIAGGLCKQWLEEMGIHIGAHIYILDGCYDDYFDDVNPDFSKIRPEFPVLKEQASIDMRAAIQDAKEDGDSVGGVLETVVAGMPAGVGEPWFDTLEGVLAKALFSVPAVKGVEFGAGFGIASMRGSEANDPFCIKDGAVATLTNNSGGINGGISNGMPIVFRSAIRPTPTISKEQQTVDLEKGENSTLEARGRHDPCIVHRARVVVDSITALALCDMLSIKFGTDWLAK